MTDLSAPDKLPRWVRATPHVVTATLPPRPPSPEYVRGYERGYLDGIARAHELIDRLLNSPDPLGGQRITLFEQEVPR